jgi:hypothetical protein
VRPVQGLAQGKDREDEPRMSQADIHQGGEGTFMCMYVCLCMYICLCFYIDIYTYVFIYIQLYT